MKLHKIIYIFVAAALILVVWACSSGGNGSSCTVEEIDGETVITCDDGTSATIGGGGDGGSGIPGKDGKDGTDGTDGDDGTNGTDGGLSDPIYFTDKETILITIADKTKTYGEVLPELTAESIELVDLDGNSALIGSSALTAAEIARIQSIAFEAPNVSALTNAGLWAIKADVTDPLNPASGVTATDPLDISLLDQYNFAFFDKF